MSEHRTAARRIFISEFYQLVHRHNIQLFQSFITTTQETNTKNSVSSSVTIG